MSFGDLGRLSSTPAPGGTPQIQRAVVTTPPRSFNDVLVAVPVGTSLDWPETVPAYHWQPHGSAMPVKGTTGLLILDSQQDAWFVAYDVPQPAKPTWLPVTPTNGWTARTGDPTAIAKDALGFVHMRGRISGGANGSQPFSLIPGYRPGNSDDTYAAAGFSGTAATAAFAAITSAGAVAIWYAPGTTEVGLGGITFLAEN